MRRRRPKGRPPSAAAPAGAPLAPLADPPAWQQLQRLTPLASTRTPDGPRLLFRTDDEVIGQMLHVTGSFDPEGLATALEVLWAAGRAAGGTFLDVGANIGTTTVPALLGGGFDSAVCVEPDPENLRLLRCNLALNDLQDRADVVAAGVSAADGELLLEESADNRGDHRLRVPGGAAGDGSYDEARRRVRPVPVLTLDRVLDRTATQVGDVGVVWVDTQGHEGHVLASAGRLLQAGVPFVVELWPYGLDRAGGRALLLDVVRARFRHVVDLADPRRRLLPAGELGRLADSLTGVAHTDVVLLP